MFDIRKYNNVILDFDGVIIDTNEKKEENINIALSKHMKKIPYEKCLTFDFDKCIFCLIEASNSG